MRIAMMVRGFLTTPVPKGVAYSPATVAQDIAEGLESLGHAVTFFGPEGTHLNVSAITTCGLRPLVAGQQDFDSLVGGSDLFTNYLPSLYDTKMARQMLVDAKAGLFDCVIFNHFESVIPLAALFPEVPVINILHDFIDDPRREVLDIHKSPNQHFISISDNQRHNAPDLNYAATIHNGIDSKKFSFQADAEDYLIFSGRITPTKGVKEAVQIAMQSNSRLLIAGNLGRSDYWYFDENVKPFLNDRILYLGMLEQAQLVKYYQKAKALLVPIQWEEPFGLTMAEANSCGTPVIAFGRGSVSEIISDRKTGFVVDNSAEMIMSISKLDTINRSDCRKHAQKHFTKEQMVRNYEKVLLGICTSDEKIKPMSLSKALKGVKKRLKSTESALKTK